MPSALVLIADGTEEMEFTITYDTLVRAGIHTTSAFVPEQDGKSTSESASASESPRTSSPPPAAQGSRGIKILPDIYLDYATCGPDTFDLLVIPGGAKGAATMSRDAGVQRLVGDYLREEKLVGMICAGSLAAMTAGLPSQPLTSHPSVRSQLVDRFAYSEEPVVVSGHLITSRGPGTAFPFALTLVELLCGPAKRNEVYGPMVFPAGTPF